MNKKKSKKNKPATLKLKGILRATKNPKLSLARHIVAINFNEFKKTLPLLMELPAYRSYLLKNCSPYNIKELRREIPFAYFPLDKCLYLYAFLIEQFHNEINFFLEKKDQFEKALLLKNKSSAYQCLNEIEAKLGWSSWLIENRLAAIQEFEGLEEQIEFKNSIVNEKDNDPFVSVLIDFYSMRAEPNLSYFKFNEALKKTFSEADNSNSIMEFFYFKLNPLFMDDIDDKFTDLLNLEFASSIIDRYLFFIRICQKMTSKGVNLNHIKEAISLLKKKIQDIAIENLLIAHGLKRMGAPCEKTKSIFKILDNYNTGNYKETIALSETFLQKHPSEILIHNTYIKSFIKTGHTKINTTSTSLKNDISKTMFNIALKTDSARESFQKLAKIITQFSWQRWAVQLLSFCIKEYKPRNFGVATDSERFCLLNSTPYLPEFFLLLDEKYSTLFNSELIKFFPESPTIILDSNTDKTNINSDYFHETELFKNQKQKYKAISLLKNNEPMEAMLFFKNLLNIDDPLTYQDAISGIIRCHIESESYLKCVKVICDTYILNREFLPILPISELVEVLSDFELENPGLEIPIIFDLYSKYISNEKDMFLFEAYEDFLMTQGLKKPSELRRVVNKFEKKALTYFLRSVCVNSVMDSSEFFTSSDEVQRERILVCQLLTEIDDDNFSTYTDEIKTISQQLMIREGLKEIEESKIYVDVDGLKQSLEKRLKENYARYLSLASVLSINEDPDYIIIPNEKFENVKIKVPSSNRHNLFFNLVFEIRNEFVANNEYGLDGYLSVGIRHGTLIGQLRSPLEAFKLITQKNLNGEYNINEYWLRKFDDINADFKNSIDKSLKKFSEEIDTLIEAVKNEWIQIQTEEIPSDGLFNYFLIIEEIEELQKKIDETVSFEEFLDTVIEELWRITEINLQQIRNIFKTTLKMQFNYIFIALAKEIEEANDYGDDVVELVTVINNARIQLQYEIDKIANWFRRAKGSEIDSYDISFPINIALEMVNNINPNYQLTIKNPNDYGKKLKGYTLKDFVNIFFMLFDNILKHNEVNNHTAKIEAHNDGNYLTIIIKNSITYKKNFEDLFQKIKKIKKSLKKEMFLEKVRVEGGSGFHKIEKILKIDLACEHELDFNITDNKQFEVFLYIQSMEISL